MKGLKKENGGKKTNKGAHEIPGVGDGEKRLGHAGTDFALEPVHVLSIVAVSIFSTPPSVSAKKKQKKNYCLPTEPRRGSTDAYLVAIIHFCFGRW